MQQTHGVRPTLTMQKPRHKTEYKVNNPEKKKPGSQRIAGHDKDLKDFKQSGASINVIIDGFKFEGCIVDSDKYTITIIDVENDRVTIFKHAILFFYKSK